MSSHPCYASFCPATDTCMAEHISARCFASPSTGKLVCFLTCKLHAGCCWEPVNQWHAKIEFVPVANITAIITPLTSLRLISSHPQTEIDTSLSWNAFPFVGNLNLLCSKFYFFMTNCNVAVWVGDCRGSWWFCVKLSDDSGPRVNVAEPLLHLLCPHPPGVVPSSPPALCQAWLMGWGANFWVTFGKYCAIGWPGGVGVGVLRAGSQWRGLGTAKWTTPSAGVGRHSVWMCHRTEEQGEKTQIWPGSTQKMKTY